MKFFIDHSQSSEKRYRLGLFGGLVTVGILALLAPIFLPSYTILTIIVLFKDISIAQGWNVIGGYTGRISFGHVGFFGIGAYTAALLAVNWKAMHYMLNITLAGIGAMIVALLVGYPFLRLKGPYFAIGTLGFAEIIRVFALNLTAWTGGALGIQIPASFFLKMPTGAYYYTMLGIAFLSSLIVYLFSRSDIGLACQAIREDDEAAEALGINVTKSTIVAFSISAFAPGVAGAFYFYFTTFIEPNSSFATAISLQAVASSFLGGAGTVVGPIIGAVILTVIVDMIRPVFTYSYLIIYGVVLIVLVHFMPGGIMGVIKGTHPHRLPLPLFVTSRGSDE